jgi:hypothetical protein
MRLGFELLLTALLIGSAARAQQQPLPDVPTLLREVEAHQAQMEKARENYTFVERSVTTELNKDGSVKKTETEEDEVFFVNTHEVQRKVKKNGQPLSPDEQQKETERVTKEVEKAQKTSPGQSQNGDQISVGRMLQIMKTSTPRREMLDGRSTIVFDFTGDPHADTHGRAESATKKIAGTVWLDEHDLQVRRLTATFDGDFHAGFGLFTLVKGSSFVFDQKLVNNELWLPVTAHVHIVAKAIGFFGYRGEIDMQDNNYQRFHVDAEPGAAAKPAATP